MMEEGHRQRDRSCEEEGVAEPGGPGNLESVTFVQGIDMLI